MAATPLALGLLVLALAWLGPLPSLAAHSFTAQLAMHMAVVAVAAPLLAAGVAHGRLDPARAAPRIFAAIPASLVELVVVWGWHMPALHEAARARTAWLVVEQATFLAAGLLLWMSALGGPPELRQARRAAGVIGLLLTSMHMTLLGALLALAPRTLYGHSGHAVLFAPLEDQHVGGALMLLAGGASYLAGGLWLTTRMLHGAPAGTQEA